jgi:hypothetical protein
MRPQDRDVFFAAADHFQVWILVRRTKPAACLYVCKPGFYAKPIDCKAKTADRDLGQYRLAGLVTDPTRHPSAFDPVKLPEAQEKWKEFIQFIGGPLFAYNKGPKSGETGRRGYNLDLNPRSAHFGCVTLNRLYLHGDYDLYDIIDPKNPRDNTATEEIRFRVRDMVSPLVPPVRDWINGRIGEEVVHHGAEMQFGGGHREQTVDGFLPKKISFTIETEKAIREIYKDALEGRLPLVNKAK